MRGESGFTLIEILLVALTIGILAALALPTFLGERTKADDADAKSNAANVRVHVESCAVHGDNTYADCATAAQIQATGLPIGMLRLPPFGQFAAAGGNGGASNGNGNNGAQCIVQSNGARSCEQTPIGGSGGSTGTTTTTTGVTTGGSAPNVGDCVEGGDVEVGCVGIIASSDGYTITAVSKSTHVFKFVNAGGELSRPCTPKGQGGCPAAGIW